MLRTIFAILTGGNLGDVVKGQLALLASRNRYGFFTDDFLSVLLVHDPNRVVLPLLALLEVLGAERPNRAGGLGQVSGQVQPSVFGNNHRKRRLERRLRVGSQCDGASSSAP